MSAIESERTCFRSSSEEHICSDSCTKMEGELAALMDMFHSVKRAGRSATLTLSTNNGKATQVRFAIELDDALPPPSTSSSTSTSAAPTSTPATGSRRHRGPSKKAKAKARAAKHRASLAAATSPTDSGGDEGASPSKLPPPAHAQGLLQPRPPAFPGQTRKIITKLRRSANTWSTMTQLDGEAEESKSNGEEFHDDNNIDPFSIYPTINEGKLRVRRQLLHCTRCRHAPSNTKVNINCTLNANGDIGICHACRDYHLHDL